MLGLIVLDARRKLKVHGLSTVGAKSRAIILHFVPLLKRISGAMHPKMAHLGVFACEQPQPLDDRNG